MRLPPLCPLDSFPATDDFRNDEDALARRWHALLARLTTIGPEQIKQSWLELLRQYKGPQLYIKPYDFDSMTRDELLNFHIEFKDRRELMADHKLAKTLPKRVYHTLVHVYYALPVLDALRHLAPRADLLELVIWLHDSVYDPRRIDNEERSADFAEALLSKAGIAADDIAFVRRGILYTKSHTATEDIDLQIIHDVDLSIFGAPSILYRFYAESIREEYDYTQPFYAHVRRRFLKSMLSREHIYLTAPMRDQAEVHARENIKWELDHLSYFFRKTYLSTWQSYQNSLATFQHNRHEWLKEHEGKVAYILDGELIRIDTSEHIARLRGALPSATDDHGFEFVIGKEVPLSACMADDWELLCEPFLDTDDPASVHHANLILKQRGYSDFKIRWMRKIACSGVWWNMFWWEWVALGYQDVRIGWMTNALVLFVPSLLLGWRGIFIWALICFFWFGFWGLYERKRKKIPPSRTET